MEPIILELEREKSDLLIIAHESVLRVLYGYLMACDAMAIPKLRFPRDEIIEVGRLPPLSETIANSRCRSSLLATRMKPGVSTFPIFHLTSSLPRPKT
jgi:hypothetical protein